MSSFTGTFSADNQVSNAITLKPGQSVSYSITTSALTGSIVFEKTIKVGKGFSTVDTMTATDSGTYSNESAQDEIVRLRCVALDEGAVETVDYSLADSTSEASQDFTNPATGLYELRFTDDGAEFRRQVLLGVAPSYDYHAATKLYVDGLINGLKWKQSVKCATTANGTLATAFANGQTVDGVTLATGDRILLKDQSTASQNGIYVVAASGAPTRSTDADSGSELVSAAVNVEQGTTNADTDWVCTNNSITLGSTSITFVSKSSTTNHNSTAGLQGGTTSQYYHLTSAQATSVGNIVTSGYAEAMNQSVSSSSSPTFAGTTLGNTGLNIKDTDASHNLNIVPGSNLTANRILTLTTGDASRTITLSGNPTLADWFDQAVKSTSTPTFAGLLSTGGNCIFIAPTGTNKVFVKAASGNSRGLEFHANAATDVVTIMNGFNAALNLGVNDATVLELTTTGANVTGTYSVGGTQVLTSRQSAIADLSYTATSGSFPTPNGSVTVANAAIPTVTELQEFCVELAAKLNTALAMLRTHGLIA